MEKHIRQHIPLEEFTVHDISGDIYAWECRIETSSLSTSEDVDKFISAFNRSNDFDVMIRNKKKIGPNALYVVNNNYRCEFDTRYQGTQNHKKVKQQKPHKRFKNCYCPFNLTVKVLKVGSCKIFIEFKHDHDSDSLEATSFRKISAVVVEEVLKLFENGFTPALAYSEYMKEVRDQCQSDLEFSVRKCDRSTCPNRRDFNYLYKKFYDNVYGGKNGTEMFNCLEAKLQQYKKENPSFKYKYITYDPDANQPLIVILMTPLMVRICKKVRQSCELLFIDSSGNMDEHSLRIFLLCTHSVAGALPVCIVITSDEKYETLHQAFSQWLEMAGQGAFFGKDYPSVVMTDNCDELRRALGLLLPHSTLLLCQFHILQQVWRWLFDKDHGISIDDRKEIMTKFRPLVNSLVTETEFTNMSDIFLEMDVLKKYQCAVNYFTELMTTKEQWARCYRQSLIIRGGNTNNYVEAQFLVLKDTILSNLLGVDFLAPDIDKPLYRIHRRQRQFNINMLLEKILVDFEDHYKLRLMSVADNSFDGIYSRRFLGLGKLKKEGCGYNIPTNEEKEKMLNGYTKLVSNVYSVPSKVTEKFYIVDMDIGRCECVVGRDGSPCAHQYFLWTQNVAQNLYNFVPVFTPQDRQFFSYLACGESMPLNYYKPLHGQPALDPVIRIKHVEPEELLKIGPIEADSEMNYQIHENSENDEQQEDTEMLKIEALDALESLYFRMHEDILKENSYYNKGVIKMNKNHGRGTLSHNAEQMHTYKKPRSLQCGTIKVTTSRRVTDNGSKAKQDTQSKDKSLPTRPASFKRTHDMSSIIEQNKPATKSISRVPMQSRTKNPVPKKKEVYHSNSS